MDPVFRKDICLFVVFFCCPAIFGRLFLLIKRSLCHVSFLLRQLFVDTVLHDSVSLCAHLADVTSIVTHVRYGRALLDHYISCGLGGKGASFLLVAWAFRASSRVNRSWQTTSHPFGACLPSIVSFCRW